MSDFLINLLNRHMELTKNVQPRMRGRFEPDAYSSIILTTNDLVENNIDDDISAKQSSFKKQETKIRSIEPLDNSVVHKNDDTKVGRSKKITIMNSETENSINNKIQDGVFHQQFDEHQPVRTKQSFIQSAKFNKGKSVVLESPTNATGLENIDIGSNGLLGLPPSLTDWKSELNQESFIKDIKTETEPVIKVNIGRIEVRAVTQQTPLPPRPKASPRPKLTLDDYLKQRNGGQR